MGVYTVGTGKDYTTLQAAWDALVANFPSGLTEDWLFLVSGGETFTKAGSGVYVLAMLGLAAPLVSRRITIAGTSATNKAIIDGQSNNGYISVNMNTTPKYKFTIRNFRMKSNGAITAGIANLVGGDHQILDGSIIEQCDIEHGGIRGIHRFASSTDADPTVIKNCYIHGSASAYGLWATEDCGNSRVFGNTFRKVQKLTNTDASVTKHYFKDNIFKDLSQYTYHFGGSEAQLIANLTMSNNLGVDMQSVYLHRESAPNQDYTLAQFQAVFGEDTDLIQQDPLLISLADPHILPESPALRAGVAIGGLLVDFDEQERATPTAIGCDDNPSPFQEPKPKAEGGRSRPQKRRPQDIESEAFAPLSL